LLHYLISRHLTVPHVTTLHGRLDTLELLRLYERFQDMPMISISNAALTVAVRKLAATIYHGYRRIYFGFTWNPVAILHF
jgi:hypothetical protein